MADHQKPTSSTDAVFAEAQLAAVASESSEGAQGREASETSPGPSLLGSLFPATTTGALRPQYSPELEGYPALQQQQAGIDNQVIGAGARETHDLAVAGELMGVGPQAAMFLETSAAAATSLLPPAVVAGLGALQTAQAKDDHDPNLGLGVLGMATGLSGLKAALPESELLDEVSDVGAKTAVGESSVPLKSLAPNGGEPVDATAQAVGNENSGQLSQVPTGAIDSSPPVVDEQAPVRGRSDRSPRIRKRPGEKFTPDQGALIDLAKGAQRSGISTDDAQTLMEWSDEFNVNYRDDTDLEPQHWVGGDHIHIGPINHIQVKK